MVVSLRRASRDGESRRATFGRVARTLSTDRLEAHPRCSRMRQLAQRGVAHAAECERGQIFSTAASPSEPEADGHYATREMLDFGVALYGTDRAW